MNPEYIIAGFVAICALIGVIYNELKKRIDGIEQGINCKVDRETCDLKLAGINKDVLHLHELIALSNDQNSKEHSELTAMQKDIHKGLENTGKQLNEITKCLVLLSEKIPCKANEV